MILLSIGRKVQCRRLHEVFFKGVAWSYAFLFIS